jgi:LTXXQ motif family protein
MAAPAPHVTAPRMAAPPPRAATPHFAAPARNMAVPHGGGPRFSAGRAAPHRATPDIARERGRPERGRFASGGGPRHGGDVNARARDLNQRAAGLPNSRESRRHALESSRPVPGSNPAARQGPASAGHETVGRVGPRANESRTEQSRLEQRRAPIIRNPVFADQRMARRGGGAVLPQETFRGRFMQSALHDRRHYRHAGIVIGFVGPLFWPYAYNDFVDYTFSPYAYDTFWPYAYDDVFAGIYGGYAPEYYAAENAYAYAGSPASQRAYDRATNSGGGNASQSASAERICTGEAKGVTDFAIQKIAQQVGPDQKQQDLLDALKAASVKAVDIMQKACPTELPSTPTGRLAAMRARVDAMLKAVEVVRPALDTFYQSLNDEQRERFIAIDQGEQAAKPQRSADLNHLCQGDLGTRSGLPIARIERTLHLNPDQQTGLKALDEATLESAKMLQAKCQPDQSLTPPGRLAAMEDRLQVMLKALDATQAALSKFYGSLSDEQKAQFDRISVKAS